MTARRDSPGPRLMSIRDASAYLGIPAKTLYGLVGAKRICYVRIAGRGRIWFERDALDRWIEQNRVQVEQAPEERRAQRPPARDISDLMPPESERRFA